MAHFERPIDWKTKKKKKFIVMMILFGPDQTILIQNKLSSEISFKEARSYL